MKGALRTLSTLIDIQTRPVLGTRSWVSCWIPSNHVWSILNVKRSSNIISTTLRTAGEDFRDVGRYSGRNIRIVTLILTIAARGIREEAEAMTLTRTVNPLCIPAKSACVIVCSLISASPNWPHVWNVFKLNISVGDRRNSFIQPKRRNNTDSSYEYPTGRWESRA